ncbi:MAG: protein kinase [Myxococcales bacterium]|nr:protein kinase [Myxococcales bacterium]MCB9717877.1 protein kinase [Myxococcales bacterium]
MPLDLQPGDVYAGTIRIHRILGVGSFARVYEVEHPGYPRRLALKLTREPVRSGEQAQRALREITILRSLTNPHVVRTFDCGLRPDGHIYLLMDLLVGVSLDEWHDFGEPLHPAKAVTIVHQACLGLAEAHAMGVVHRDVKPENIFIERDGKIKMLDFGLARSWDGSPVVGTNATEAHMVVGTPHYSQPEQLRTRVLSPASDVYSLATILYELLSGRAPFFPEHTLPEIRERLRNDPTEWLKAHARTEATPLRELPGCEHLPDSLVRGVARALHKDPDARPPNAGAFANVLGLVLHRDMDIPVAAKMRVLNPDDTVVERLFLPGSYRIGSGRRCEIKLRDDAVPRVHAVLEWSGVPNRPHLRPLHDDGTVRVNDVVIDTPVELGQYDEFSVGETRMAVVI